MSRRYDLAILGAGPAGASAAIEARKLGLDTIVLDEAAAAGGQVYRAPAAGIAPKADSDAAAGEALRSALAASGAELRFERRVWLGERGFGIEALGPDGNERIEAEKLIVAAGAVERHLPVPGWTLPGAMGLAAATILLKSQGVLPGRRVVVAGAGPLLLLVAAKILEAGGEVAAIVDANGPADWLGAAARGGRPRLALRGVGWLAAVARRRTPIFWRSVVRRIHGDGEVSAVEISGIGAGAATRLDCDAVCLGFGLRPSTEVTSLLGARHVFDEEAAGWRPEVDGEQRSSVAGLFAAGDGAGVYGAAAAPLQGRIAAFAAARELGRVDDTTQLAALQSELASARRFGIAMNRLSRPPEALFAVPPDTIVCRCEVVTRAELDDAAASGAHTLADLKAATRCGMGPCGGRICAEAAAGILARAIGVPRSALEPWTARVPLRPVPIERIAADLAYEDLPIPEPAPL